MKLKIATVLTILSMVVGGLYTLDTLYERKAHAAATEKRVQSEIHEVRINQEILTVDIMLERVEDELLDILRIYGTEKNHFPVEIFERYIKLKDREERLNKRYDILYEIKIKDGG